MAKIEYNPGDFGDVLDKLGSRENIRAIVEAGSAAAVDWLKERTQMKGHVVTGKMMESVSAGPLHEDLGRAWQYVYPGQGGDDTETVKAFVINYGRGGRKTEKTGDKFITGDKKQLEDIVRQAMAAKAEQIKNDIMR